MDETRFKQGFTWNEYLEYLNENMEALKKDRDEAEVFIKEFHENFERVLMAKDTIMFITNVHSKVNVVALAEYWCPDVRHNLSVMARLAEQNPNIELRIFPRDMNLELMKEYLFRGKSMSIPAFGFFDANFKEFGQWLGGRPKICWDWIEELGKDKAYQKIKDFYVQNKGQETLNEFMEILRSR